MKKLSFITLAFLAFACGGSKEHTEESQDQGQSTEATEDMFKISEDQGVFFVNLEDGDVVTSPVKVEMGVKGMEVEPAGEAHKNKGHHHLLIDHPFTPSEEVIPADSTHFHFGKGQVETEVALTPGEHTLTLQFANGFHQSYGEKMSKSITVQVVGSEN